MPSGGLHPRSPKQHAVLFESCPSALSLFSTQVNQLLAMSSKVESSLPIPNELTLLPNADLRGIVSPTAARLREAILAATDFIKAPHPSDSSEYVQECKDCEVSSFAFRDLPFTKRSNLVGALVGPVRDPLCASGRKPNHSHSAVYPMRFCVSLSKPPTLVSTHPPPRSATRQSSTSTSRSLDPT